MAAGGGSKLVLRGGAGFFYDRVPGNTIGHAVEQSPPYAIRWTRAPGPTSSRRWLIRFKSIPLGTFPTRWLNFANNTGSDLAQSFMVDELITPLIYSYNLNVQYQLAKSWVLEARLCRVTRNSPAQLAAHFEWSWDRESHQPGQRRHG